MPRIERRLVDTDYPAQTGRLFAVTQSEVIRLSPSPASLFSLLSR